MNSQQHYILVGPVPPPVAGQSLAFQMLVEEFEQRNLPHQIVNLSGKKGSFNVSVGKRALQYFWILLDYVRKTSFGKKTVYITIAQSLQGFWRDFFMIWYAKCFGHSVVCHLHGGNYGHFFDHQPGWIRRLIRATLLKADHIYVLGERLRGMFDFEPRLGPKLDVVCNGLPFILPDTIGAKKLPSNPDEPVVILYLSNLIESKGYLHVLEAIDLLVKDGGPKVKCLFFGRFLSNVDDILVRSAEHGRELFEAFVKERGLEGIVEYNGTIQGEEKLKVLQQSHFFVLPTQYDNEGQPLSIIEAMAFGSVVISTDYRGIPEMVIDGDSGVLVPFAEPGAIADAIKELCGEPARYERMSLNAKKHFKANFTREAHLEKIVSLLEGTTGKRLNNRRYGRMTNV
ncbi:glycosyltransferase family 4 protein [Paenibacillus mesophilus]|uniref:glycosyltransferase family 4 protein n=1 Tax=Paenibacillus mesophilus TaxID=2582849 RepID=UPI00130509A0|nr:glycosyltransferase family 4 protein [Paenibacillus mesophilus]